RQSAAHGVGASGVLEGLRLRNGRDRVKAAGEPAFALGAAQQLDLAREAAVGRVRAYGDVLNGGYANPAGFGETRLQRLLELGLARARSDALDQPLGGILEHPRRPARRRVAAGATSCRVGGLFGN